MRLDSLELLALVLLVATVFVAARTWGQLTVPVSTGLLTLAFAQALWLLGVIPPLGVFGARTWAAVACGMLLVLGLLAGGGSNRPALLPMTVAGAAAVELFLLAGLWLP
jgi:hypothetical protein